MGQKGVFPESWRRDLVREWRKPVHLGRGSSRAAFPISAAELLGAALDTSVSRLRRADPVQKGSGAFSPLGKLGRVAVGTLSVRFVWP